MGLHIRKAVSALWWAGKLSVLAAKHRDPKLNSLARRFHTEFQKQHVEEKRRRLKRTRAGKMQPAE